MPRNRRYGDDDPTDGDDNDRFGDAVPEREKTDMVAKGEDTDDGVSLDGFIARKSELETDVPRLDYRGIVDEIYPDPVDRSGTDRLESNPMGKHHSGRSDSNENRSNRPERPSQRKTPPNLTATT